jgi:hypothetical protein
MSASSAGDLAAEVAKPFGSVIAQKPLVRVSFRTWLSRLQNPLASPAVTSWSGDPLAHLPGRYRSMRNLGDDG